jgi:VWFA-related protein
MRERLIATLASCLLTASLVVEGSQSSATRQASSDSEPQSPVFRAAIDSVDVDVIVTDRKGKFVTGLTPDDFEVYEDGLPQEVSTFSVVDLPTSRSVVDAGGASPRDALVSEGRRFIMILNGHGPRLARAARLFVDQAFGPNDQMAVYYNNPVNNAFVEGQPFTASKALLRAVIRNVEPAFMPLPPLPATFMNRQQMANERARIELERFETLRAAMEQLSTTPGRKKAILWFGGGFQFNAGGGTARALELGLAYRDVIRTAQRHHVVIYPIDPTGLTTRMGGRELRRMAGYRMLAEDTGVEAIVGTNDFEKGYARIVREMSTYYLLGYYPRIQHQDGRFHSIRVRVKRPNLTVRARQGYFAYEPAPVRLRPPRAPDAVEAALDSLSDTLSRPVEQLAADGQIDPPGLPASDLAPGEPVLWRADSRGRAEYVRTANPRFTRTERLRVEVPTTTSGEATARLLDRMGVPLPLRLTVTGRVDEAGARRWVIVDLALAPLAQGEYVLEVVAGEAARLVAFRVVP